MHAVSLDELKRRAEQAPVPRNPLPVLTSGEVCVIAEVRPTQDGLQGADRAADLAALAAQFEAGGAHCVSVWTDSQVHRSGVADLLAVRCEVEIPVLVRDFVISSYQLWEARAAGADMVLIMAACLNQQALVSLVERTMSLGMTPVVQVHDQRDLDLAVRCEAMLIAIHGDPAACHDGVSGKSPGVQKDHGRRLFAELAPMVPKDHLRIADAGVRDPHELIEFGQAGADAVVVGESLTSSKHPTAAVHDLVTAGSHPAVRHARH